jgi:hypothetical protein
MFLTQIFLFFFGNFINAIITRELRIKAYVTLEYFSIKITNDTIGICTSKALLTLHKEVINAALKNWAMSDNSTFQYLLA